MPREKNPCTPKFRIHKATGQGYVVLNGHAHYLGRADLPATEQRYHQLIAEWLAAGRQPPVAGAGVTVNVLLARYWLHARDYYRDAAGQPTTQLHVLRSAIKPLRELYADSRAADFGPLALKAVRQRMIELGWSRTTVNQAVSRVKQVFRWAVENELVPGRVHHAVQAVAGLRRGRCAAREPQPVGPVPAALIDAVKPFGPRAQAVVRPFLQRPVGAPLFSPAEALAERRAARHRQRRTPLSCGNRPGSPRTAAPAWQPGDAYSVAAYRRAIAYACDRAFPPPAPLARRAGETVRQWQDRLQSAQLWERLQAWRRDHRWHPHQLRHNAATELRREFGVETARVLLGHRSPAVTEVYAEIDRAKAVEATLQVG